MAEEKETGCREVELEKELLQLLLLKFPVLEDKTDHSQLNKIQNKYQYYLRKYQKFIEEHQKYL